MYSWLLCNYISVPVAAPALCQSCVHITMINATVREIVINYKVMLASLVLYCFVLLYCILHFLLFISTVIVCGLFTNYCLV